MIRYGIIGRNFIVDMMLAAMAAVPETAKPSAIYSRSKNAAIEFMNKHQLRFACSDFDELASCSEIDAVYIASPNCCHYEQAKRMLEHGKHVLCEKPAAANARQVRELVELSQKKKLVFLEAMRPVYGNVLRIVRDNLSRIGTIRQVRIDYCKLSSRLVYLREGKHVNAFDQSLSNAAIMDLGCYGIHSVVHLFGKPDFINAQAVHLDTGFEALGTVLMHYPSFTAEISYSKIHQVDTPCTITGEKGSIYMDAANDTKRVWLHMNDGTDTDLGFIPDQPNDMIHELRAFDRFVNENIRPERENKNSVLTAEIIDQARAQTGTFFPSDLIQ